MNKHTKVRTTADFSEHTHRVEIFKSDTNPENEIRIDHFQKGNSSYGYIQFINTDRTLTVTGDYGNWVFCRPFVPSEDGYVSEHYWKEKLSIASSQVSERYDGDATAEELQKLIDGGLDDWGYDEKEQETLKEWFTDLLNYTDDELEYTYEAYRGYSQPDFFDNEYLPFVKTTSYQLQIVFDAFDELCNRMGKEELV